MGYVQIKIAEIASHDDLLRWEDHMLQVGHTTQIQKLKNNRSKYDKYQIFFVPLHPI